MALIHINLKVITCLKTHLNGYAIAKGGGDVLPVRGWIPKTRVILEHIYVVR